MMQNAISKLSTEQETGGLDFHAGDESKNKPNQKRRRLKWTR